MGQHLREWPPGCGFGQIPARRGYSDGAAQIRRPCADTSQCADNQRAWCCVERGACSVCQGICGGKGTDGSHDLAALLRAPCHNGQSRARVSGPIAERRNAPACFIDQIFQIQKRAAARLEAVQQHAAGRLAFVGVAKHDVAVAQGRAVVWQFLEPEYDRVIWRIDPTAIFGTVTASGAVVFDGDAAFGRILDDDAPAFGDHPGRAFGCHRGAGLVFARFAAHPDQHGSGSFGLSSRQKCQW